MSEPKYHVPNLCATNFTPHEKTLCASQATSEPVQLLHMEYWAQVKDIDLKDLMFLDERGGQKGSMRTHACSLSGERV
jgi:hypothetical protein